MVIILSGFLIYSVAISKVYAISEGFEKENHDKMIVEKRGHQPIPHSGGLYGKRANFAKIPSMDEMIGKRRHASFHNSLLGKRRILPLSGGFFGKRSSQPEVYYDGRGKIPKIDHKQRQEEYNECGDYSNLQALPKTYNFISLRSLPISGGFYG